MNENTYDKRDIIRREAVIIAGPLKIAAYRVKDLETGEFGTLQIHMTFDNMVMAVMEIEAAKLFARFVTDLTAREEIKPSEQLNIQWEKTAEGRNEK